MMSYPAIKRLIAHAGLISCSCVTRREISNNCGGVLEDVSLSVPICGGFFMQSHKERKET